MENGIFRFILRHSVRDQIVLIVLSALSLPVLYATLELPKTIVNKALADDAVFPKQMLNREFGQLQYLLILCGLFLTLVVISGAFKYYTSTYRYRVGDDLLRRLRYELIERVLRFPLPE